MHQETVPIQPDSAGRDGRDAPLRLQRRRGFSMVEMLVVAGIITLLLAMLLPALAKVRQRADQSACQSNLRQIGLLLLLYVNENKGWLYPVGPPGPDGRPTTLGSNVPRTRRWPVYVFQPPRWDPPELLCPSDYDPAEAHSYVLNQHLADHQIQYSATTVGGLLSDQVVVMGEKVTARSDYYMERNEFGEVVEPFRHGVSYGSNYLYLDLHVSTTVPGEAGSGMDPWDPPLVPQTRPAVPGS